MKPRLTVRALRKEAASFAAVQSAHPEPSIYGVTDGKAVGTYFEHRFRGYLLSKYSFSEGSSAKGIDFPGIGVDMKVTSIRQPQSSCPFKSARQKIFGLGYALLVFVYEKSDDERKRVGVMKILHTVFVERRRTADYQTTRRIREILKNDGNLDDLLAFIGERNLPVDEIQAQKIGEELIRKPPEQGFLTISNALQWRLQYRRIIEKAGDVDGIIRLV